MKSVQEQCMAAVDLWIKKQERGEIPFVLRNDKELDFTVRQAVWFHDKSLRAEAKQGDKTWIIDMDGNAKDVSDSKYFGTMLPPFLKN